MRNYRLFATAACILGLALSHSARSALAIPAGYVRQTIPVSAPPVALAFDAVGKLYAIGGSGFHVITATMQVFAADGSLETSFGVTGEDAENFFVGGMTYDSVGDRLLVTDNTTIGQIYAVGKTGGQTTIASDFPAVAGVAVRSTGEIVISTSLGAGAGGVYEINRATGAKTQKMLGLDYGAGLAFDGGDLIVQDARSESPFLGRLQRVPVDPSAGGLVFGSPSEILGNMSSAYGIVLDDDGDVFTSGTGGVFNVGGSPAAETLFFNNGRGAMQFATAIAFHGGGSAFEPFAGPAGGVLAVAADGAFGHEDEFVTLFTPALAEDFNSDGTVDGSDLTIWSANFGSQAALREQGDADGDHDVDGADFLRWQTASGATTLLPGIAANATGRQSVDVTPVPESATRQLLAIGAIILLGKTASRVNVKVA